MSERTASPRQEEDEKVDELVRGPRASMRLARSWFACLIHAQGSMKAAPLELWQHGGDLRLPNGPPAEAVLLS